MGAATHVLGGLNAAAMSNLSVRSACAILSSNNFKAILSSLVRPVHLYLEFCALRDEVQKVTWLPSSRSDKWTSHEVGER